MAARGGAGDARAIGGHGRIQALAFRVKTLQHRQTFGKTGDEVSRRDGIGAGIGVWLGHKLAMFLFCAIVELFVRLSRKQRASRMVLMQHKT